MGMVNTLKRWMTTDEAREIRRRRPYRMGRAARHRGCGIGECPFPYPPYREWWTQGWLEAGPELGSHDAGDCP